MPKTIQRTVAFYWLRLRSREAVSYRPVEDVDWESRLADLDSMKWQEKAIDGIRYDAILGKEYPILSVSEQFDPTFMQYIDRENERVTDYMDNYLITWRGKGAIWPNRRHSRSFPNTRSSEESAAPPAKAPNR